MPDKPYLTVDELAKVSSPEARWCPFCGGTGGNHFWAGSGMCPGARQNPVTNEVLLAEIKVLEFRLSLLESALKIAFPEARWPEKS